MTAHSDTREGTPTNDELAALLRSSRTIAVVGASANPDRPSHYVARYLIDHGYRVIPVNPSLEELFGERCYPDVAAIPPNVTIDVVDVFRASEHVPAIVDQAIARGVRAVWLQLGVIHAEATRRAREAGVTVVVDDCIKIKHGQLLDR